VEVFRLLLAVADRDDLERFEEGRSLAGLLQDLAQIVEVLARHVLDDGVLAVEIAVDEAHTDVGRRADVVHGRQVETAFGEAAHRRPEDLPPPLTADVGNGLRFRSIRW
jgi:hypothetical protein